MEEIVEQTEQRKVVNNILTWQTSAVLLGIIKGGTTQRYGVKDLKKAFEREKGAKGELLLPDGEGTRIVSVENTTDERVLYPKLEEACLDFIKGFDVEKKKRVKECLTQLMEDWEKGLQAEAKEQTGEKREPQQGNPKPTRGRPRNTIKDKMINDTDGSRFQKTHSLVQGKKGKQAVLYLLAAVLKGWMERPTYKEAREAFGDIGSKTGYNRYFHKERFTPEEIEGANNALE